MKLSGTNKQELHIAPSRVDIILPAKTMVEKMRIKLDILVVCSYWNCQNAGISGNLYLGNLPPAQHVLLYPQQHG